MLIRTSPFRPSLTFRSFDRAFDRAFDELASSFFAATPRTPVVDAAWHDGDLHLTVDLPGVPADKVNVSVSGRMLTMSVEDEHSTWERSITVGDALDPEKVSARYVDGRLTVVIGATEKPEVRRIEISTTAPAAAAIESTSSDAQPANDTTDNT
jgi:HSP20 family protein